MKISQVLISSTAIALGKPDTGMAAFYADPGNKAAFEAWLKARKEESHEHQFSGNTSFSKDAKDIQL
jgi:hypothetical protein